MKPHRSALAAAILGVAVATAACSPDIAQPVTQGPPPPPRHGAVAAASASASSAAPAMVFREDDFTASDRNRDPFRSYMELFKNEGPTKQVAQQKVTADRFSLDELKLVAIVTGGTQPRAMFVDPEGLGWIVTLGMLVGRTETVKGTGTAGAEYDLNWKVDRIREGDVVFVRENPSGRVPSATSVIALRPEGEETRRRR